MAFRVEIAPQALKDLDAAYLFIKKESPENAARWLLAITDKILSLKKLPARCPRAPESDDVGQEIRVLLHGKRLRAYKIFFSIHSDGAVRVFHVRHGAMRRLLSDDLKILIESW